MVSSWSWACCWSVPRPLLLPRRQAATGTAGPVAAGPRRRPGRCHHDHRRRLRLRPDRRGGPGEHGPPAGNGRQIQTAMIVIAALLEGATFFALLVCIHVGGQGLSGETAVRMCVLFPRPVCGERLSCVAGWCSSHRWPPPWRVCAAPGRRWRPAPRMTTAVDRLRRKAAGQDSAHGGEDAQLDLFEQRRSTWPSGRSWSSWSCCSCSASSPGSRCSAGCRSARTTSARHWNEAQSGPQKEAQALTRSAAASMDKAHDQVRSILDEARRDAERSADRNVPRPGRDPGRTRSAAPRDRNADAIRPCSSSGSRRPTWRPWSPPRRSAASSTRGRPSRADRRGPGRTSPTAGGDSMQGEV